MDIVENVCTVYKLVSTTWVGRWYSMLHLATECMGTVCIVHKISCVVYEESEFGSMKEFPVGVA